MQRQIKFTAAGASSVTGSFWPGDTLRCSEAQAKHFVDDARCAIYTDAPPPAEPAAVRVRTPRKPKDPTP
jgi:hypothetical protein